MDARHLLAIEEQLHDDTPILGARRRTRAAQTLIAEGSDDAMAMLAEALANGHPRRAGRAALRALTDALSDGHHAARMALCGLSLGKGHPLWAEALDALTTDEHPGLIATLQEAIAAALLTGGHPLACDALARRARAGGPGRPEAIAALYRLCEAQVAILWPSAVDALAREGSERSIALLRRAAEQSDARRLRATAVRALARRAQAADAGAGAALAREALCHIVIRHDIPGLLKLVLAAGYRPQDASTRALFLFSTAQWGCYEALDFDRRLLQAAYDAAPPPLRLRITTLARRYGRLEWARVVSAGDQSSRLAGITPAEWDETITMLADAQQWDEAWRLARRAPAVQSVRLLSLLSEARWTPKSTADRKAFANLLSLAELCPATVPRHGRLTTECVRLAGHTSWISGLAITPDGSDLIAAGLGNQAVRRWRLPGGRPLPSIEGHDGGTRCLATTRDGRYLVTGGYDNCARLWQLPKGELIATLNGPGRWVGSVSVSPNGRLLATAGDDRVIRLWTLPEAEVLATLDEHTGWVEGLAITPDGRTLISTSRDTTARLWRLPHGEPLTALEAHTRPITAMAVSHDGKLLVTGGQDHAVCLWRLPSGELLSTLTGHQAPIDAVTISPDDGHLATGSNDERIRLWELPDFSTPTRYGYSIRLVNHVQGRLKPLVGARADMSDHIIARRAEDGSVHTWSLPKGKPLMALTPPLGAPDSRPALAPISRFALTPDGRTLVSGGEDGGVNLWTSRLEHLLHAPIRETTWDDMAWAESSLREPRILEAERRWLAFALPLMRWRWRADPELAETAVFGAYDPEI